MTCCLVSGLRNTYCKRSFAKILITQHFMSRTIKSEIPVNIENDPLLKGLDNIQGRLMQEKCILVDKDDKITGCASKKDCHLLKNINTGMLHRAFSVFLFNTDGQLLLQQRSEKKITYPNHLTNTCCSHPLYTAEELEEKNARGVKKSAQRRLHQELGIQQHQIDLSEFHFLTRIHYKSGNIPVDGVWGEHEIDYVLIVQKDVELLPNPDEVKMCKYVTKEELQKLVEEADSSGTLLTPWFKLIVDKFLYKWWNDLDNVSSHANDTHIHRMID
ncbi:isopentenyl-diphosphate Delta-isomerase 1-like [Ylistrum balloti]|uniref:isopentenyl-diphosphate Delta-isomerase 1-like n=1 Tax=Ylistrum balloti TaxID=509963 RepID=UPI002905A8AD|nr:isopentenyl-diphosphate Delta-isomerase 1-like [Ylistrum balloti]XP_060086097.1 isopentenyl-diphosphate Delta-isomerase 1-like [Ylistrum balloti]